MNVQKLNESIEVLKNNLGQSLVACDIFTTEDAQSIAGYNTQPVASALFCRITNMMNESLADSGFPTLGKFYLLDLANKFKVVVLPLGEYQWGMLIDGTKIQLGLALNVALPKAIKAFEEAAKSD